MRNLIENLESRYAWSSLAVDGHKWRWLDTAATAPAVVLLPGSVGDSAMFVRTLLSLGERLRLVAVTYPDIAHPYELARGLKAVLDHLHLPPSVLVGSSFSAYWIQFFALSYPDQVRKLVIGNGFTDACDLAKNPLFDPEWVASVPAQELHEKWLQRVEATPTSPLQQLQKLMLAERQTPENLRARFLGVTQAQPCPPLTLDQNDIMVIDCEDDPLIPKAAQKRIRQRYPGARHKSLSSGGHYPQILNPEAYEKVLLEIALT